MSGMRLRFFRCLLLASRMAVAIGGGGTLLTDVAHAEPAHSLELVNVIAIPETLDEARRASLPRVPTVVLTSTQPVGQYPLQDDQAMQLWLRQHNQLVARTPGAKHIVVESSNHGTILEKPVVTEQVLQIVAAARARTR